MDGCAFTVAWLACLLALPTAEASLSCSFPKKPHTNKDSAAVYGIIL